MIDPTVQVALVTGVAALATATVPILLQRKQLRRVEDQVVNSHSTNLRDDVDRVIEGLERVLANQHRHDAELAALRADLRVEREERLELERRIP